MINLNVEGGLDATIADLEYIFVNIAKLKVTLKSIKPELQEYFMALSGRITLAERNDKKIAPTPQGERREISSIIISVIEPQIKFFAKGKLYDYLLVLSKMAGQISSATNPKAERESLKSSLSFIDTFISDLEVIEEKITSAQRSIREAKKIIDMPKA